METTRWRTLDPFCGAAGGWTLGLHRAGFTTVAACEIDSWRRAVFGRNNPGVKLYDDVRALGADRLFGDLGFLPEIVCGSPPCQDASTANAKGRGVDGERTGLFFEAVRIVREVRPRWVLLENVPGLRTRGYDRVHDELEAAGYAVWPLVVGAVHAGAPHLRKRVWIVALAKSAQEQIGRAGFAWPEIERVPADPDARGLRIAELSKTSEQETAALESISAIAAPMHGSSLARGEPDGDRAETAADAESRASWPGLREGGSIIDRPLLADRGREAIADAHQDEQQERRGAEPNEEEHAPAVDLLGAFRHWNGGPPDLGRVDDGVSEALASRRGIGRACLAAYGDAVLPQITEALGHAVQALERRALCNRAAQQDQR